MKQKGLRLAASLLIIALLSGCAGATKPAEKPAAADSQAAAPAAAPAPAPVKADLRALWWGNQDRHNLYIKNFEAYSKKFPNVTVQPEFSAWGEYWNKVSVKVASNDAPDIMQMDLRYLAEYAQRGALLDLTPYMGKELDVSGVDKGLLDAGKLDGKQYAICLGGNTLSMMVNKTLLGQAGLSVPKDDWTWSDFEQLGKEFQAKMGKGYWLATDQSADVNRFEFWARQQGVPGLWKNGKLTVNESLVTDWYKMWERYRQEGIVPPADVTQATGTNFEESLWAKKKAPMSWNWNNEYQRFSSVVKDEVVMIPYPRSGKAEGHYLKCSLFYSVSSKTKFPKESAQVVSYWINDPESVKTLGTTAGIPVTKPSIKVLKDAGLTPINAGVFNIFEKISAFAAPAPEASPKGATEVNSLFQRLSEEVRYGKKTPEQAAKELVEETNKIIAKANP
ncbi:MAG: ABC transporter substrate-binding protein [Bacillota bacterium]